MLTLPLARRRFLIQATGLAAGLAVATPTRAIELDPASDADQSEALQAALHAATGTGRLSLPAGRFSVSGLLFPGQLVVEGVPGATWLVASGAPIGMVSGVADLVLCHIGFTGDSGDGPLLGIEGASSILVDSCRFRDSGGIALGLSGSSARIRDCDFSGHGDAAIHAIDCTGLAITGNAVANCGNAGIRVWRSESGFDGSIVAGNRISAIDWRDGGNGQNGNGVNVFRADGVLVSGNVISDCAFTAVRLNATNNTIISDNQCRNSGEVAIFSEFGFSGSIISGNLVDGAAGGISMTNLDTDGHMAVCTGNIVRNIAPRSEVNPDTSPFGIFAEADAAITGNIVDNVPGLAIGAGWGPYLRNVLVADNVVTNALIGIGVSVAEGAGAVTIGANRIDASQHAIAGLAWTDVVEPDLAAAADRYPLVTFR